MKNKILIIPIIFILISFCFINTNCFASNNEYDFSDMYNYIPTREDNTRFSYILYTFDNYSTVILAVCNDADVSSINFSTKVYGEDRYYFVCGYDGCPIKRYTFDFNSNTFKLIGDTSSHHVFISKSNFDNITFISSSNDVYVDDTLVFHVPPVEEITLAGIMKQAGEQATQEMEEMILVVIVATVGLIIFVIGLKKGLTVLMNGLKN